MAYVNTSSSFRSLDRFREGDKEYLYAVCGSGIDGDTPVRVGIGESGYYCTALAASLNGYVGLSAEGSLASGVVGMIQIGGYRAGVQGSAAGISGTAGAPLLWSGTTVYATATSTALGLPDGGNGQIGRLTETLSASTTANVFLTGQWTTAV